MTSNVTMTADDKAVLETVTTEQLLVELMGRSTFQGVVLYTEGRHVFQEGEKPFQFLHSRNMTRDESLSTMERAAETLKLRS